MTMRTSAVQAAAFIAAAAVIAASGTSLAADGRTKVLATTFPIYVLTRAVTEGDRAIDLELLLSPDLGCPHSYVVTPQDVRRIGAADVIVMNGLGLDNSLVAAQNRAAGARARLIDSSAGLSGAMNYNDGDNDHDEHAEEAAHHGEVFGEEDHRGCPHYQEHHGGAAAASEHEGHAHEGHAHEGHVHEGINPHMFASPLMAAQIAANIADGLGKLKPASAGLYKRNAAAFDARMHVLNSDIAAAVKKLKNRRIVTEHDAFDYLARDVGLEIVAVVQAHPGTEPSAAEMMKLVKAVRTKGAGAVFVEPQYPARVPKTIAAEAGIPFGTLDPVATGPAGSGAAYYEKVMRQNIINLEKALGTR